MFTLVFNLNIITVPLFQFNGKEFNIIVTHRFHLHIYIPVPWIQYAVLVSITILIVDIMIWLSLYRMFGSCCHLPFPEMIAEEKKTKLKYHSEASQLSDTTRHHIDFPLKGGRVFPSNLCSKAPPYWASRSTQLQQTLTSTCRHRNLLL